MDMAKITGRSFREIERALTNGETISISKEQLALLKTTCIECEWEQFARIAEAGDYGRALSTLGSASISAGIAVIWNEYGLSGQEARALLEQHWTRCDGPKHDIPVL